MTKQEAVAMAVEIGQDIVSKGRHPASAASWAPAYSWWRDVVDAIGQSAAVSALVSAAWEESGREAPEPIVEARNA